MNKAYVILAHKNPSQVLKLIKRLDDSFSTFFLHLDKRVPLEQFQQVIDYSSCVKLVERVNTYWGSYNLVQATLNGLQSAAGSGSFDRITLLSGQDYPVKSNRSIDAFFEASEYKVFIEYYPLPNFNKWPTTGGWYRVNKYFLGLEAHQKFLAKCLNFSLRFVPFIRRRLPKDIQPYAGSQWWTMDGYTAKYVLNYVASNPAYIKYHKYTFAPDEVFFQSILLNAKDERIQKSICNDNLVYTVWENASSSHPRLIQKEDVDNVVGSNSLFARKFEQETDSEVFDAIDALAGKITTAGL
jgi:hypothetical protein